MANTSFSDVYNAFLSKITDDMYMELFPEETNDILEDLLIAAIPWFEFPKVNIFDYDRETEAFEVELTTEEINILATYMVVTWMSQQLASVNNIRMQYSGPDFKFTSQANHMGKIQSLREAYKQEGHHLQRLYKRRDISPEGASSSLGKMMEAL